jgi:threonine dehydratase
MRAIETVESPRLRPEQAAPIGLVDIERAADVLSGTGSPRPICVRTPLVYSAPFSRQFGCNIWLKLENLQKTGSYKLRGAYNNMANLPPERRARGVVTASAGNHAQGVAFAAEALDIAGRTTVFVPVGTPKVKQENSRAYGVEIREVGDTFDAAREAAYAEASESGRPFIEPFDDWNTIAGQGTIGLEILQDLPQVAGIVVPVGGGGLISGIALATRRPVEPPVVIGVEAEGAPGMIWSLEQGAPADLPEPPRTQIADGIKVSRPGDRPFRVCRLLVGRENFMTVLDTETVAAIADLMVYAKVIAEGAGAVSIAALRDIQAGRVSTVAPFPPGSDVVAVISGGNIDPSFSWRILYEQSVPNLLALRMAMPDRPGELLRMLIPIAHLNVNIIDVDVNRLDARPRMGERIVELCVAISGQAQADALLGKLRANGYHVLVSRWQDPAIDRAGNLSRSALIRDHYELPADLGPGEAEDV